MEGKEADIRYANLEECLLVYEKLHLEVVLNDGKIIGFIK